MPLQPIADEAPITSNSIHPVKRNALISAAEAVLHIGSSLRLIILQHLAPEQFH